MTQRTSAHGFGECTVAPHLQVLAWHQTQWQGGDQTPESVVVALCQQRTWVKSSSCFKWTMKGGDPLALTEIKPVVKLMGALALHL